MVWITVYGVSRSCVSEDMMKCVNFLSRDLNYAINMFFSYKIKYKKCELINKAYNILKIKDFF